MEELLKILYEYQKNNQKRWLNTQEAAAYLGYSTDGINKLKGVHLFKDWHYFKKAGKILYDRHALDEWVLETKIVL